MSLEGIPTTAVLVYLDNFIVLGSSMGDHLENIRILLQVHREEG